MTSRFRAGLSIVIVITTWLMFLQFGSTSDDLPRSSLVGPLGVPLISYERIPIVTVLAHPDRYQMREIRLVGTVTAIQTETITNRLICGRAHERTTITVEDESGQIEVIDQGACGRNLSRLKTPMLQVGQQIDVLIQMTIPTGSGLPGSSLEAIIHFVDLVRD